MKKSNEAHQRLAKIFGASTLALLVMGCASTEVKTLQLPSAERMQKACADLTGQTIAGVNVTKTERIAASAITGGSALCRVSGTRAPFLDIEVVVPDQWSGRVFHQGGGGFDGRIPSSLTLNNSGEITTVHPAVSSKGAVFVSSNGGNRAINPEQAGPGVWAKNTPEGNASADDYAYKALGKTIQFGKGVAKYFFASAPSKTYFNGCSNGGRGAYIVAQRWPQEYDGIVSGCQTMDMTGQTSAWVKVGSRAGTPAALSKEQYQAAYSAAVNACDAIDGLKDGYINNPAACNFDPAQLRCGLQTANADPKLCLSPEQIGTLQLLMSDFKLSKGDTVYSKFNWSDFSGFGASFGALGGAYVMLATQDPSWMKAEKQAQFDLDTNYPQIGHGLNRKGLDNDKAAIAAYVASGKKLISWHANGDNLLSANDHLRNYATMTSLVKELGIADPSENTRFFLVPTSTHSFGSLPQQVDWTSAIIDWVEKNQAPQQLTYTFTQAGASSPRSLPVCMNPKTPKYVSGDVNSASSYRCE